MGWRASPISFCDRCYFPILELDFANMTTAGNKDEVKAHHNNRRFNLHKTLDDVFQIMVNYSAADLDLCPPVPPYKLPSLSSRCLRYSFMSTLFWHSSDIAFASHTPYVIL